MARCDPELPGDDDGGPDCGGSKSPAGKAPRRPRLREAATKRKEYIGALAEAYDPEHAMKQADLTWTEVCELRVRHPDFAARIDEVNVAGFDRLEAGLLRLALASVAKGAPDMAFVQAVMKLRRPARAVTAPAKPDAKAEAERARRIDKIMTKFAQHQAAQPGGGGHGRSGIDLRDEALPGPCR